MDKLSNYEIIGIISCFFALLGSAMWVFGFTAFQDATSSKTKLWGEKITPIKNLDLLRMSCPIGFIILAAALLTGCINAVDGFWWGAPFWIFWAPMVCGVVTLFPFYIFGKKYFNKKIAAEKNLLFLSDTQMMRDIDSNIENAEIIFVCQDGIYLCDKRDFVFFQANYGNYGLGVLTSSKELRLLGFYFRQRYAKEFICSPVKEIMSHVTASPLGGTINFSTSETKRLLFKRK